MASNKTPDRDDKTVQLQPHKNKSASRKQWIIENVLSLGLALLVVFMIRSSVVEAFKIPSGSMIPTLLVGDHIFVNKFAYGFKVPFSDLFSNTPLFIYKREPAARGDIIVFVYPKDESLYYIKRVIGTPGDKVEMRNRVLFINGNPINKTQVAAPEAEKLMKDLDEPRYSTNNLDVYREMIPEHEHAIFQDKNNFLGDNFGPVTVPEESLFVMGDNRDFSNDSRFWGFVPYKNVKGKAMFIWLSLWLNFSDNQYIFRPTRIGTILH